MRSPAQLDNEQPARKDEDMDNATDKLRDDMNAAFREINANFREVNARIDALQRETAARIAELRQQTLDQFRLVDAKIDELRRETRARIDALVQVSNRRLERSDAQFRWLVGLMLAALLGTAGLLVKAL